MARAGTRCVECGATWRAPARYCGHCGHLLATPDAVAPGHVAARRRRPRALVLAVPLGLAGVVGAMVWAAAVGLGTPGAGEPPRPGGGDLTVEVPALDPLPADFRRPQVDCEPSGCTRWSVEVGHGTTRSFAHGLYHVTRDALLALDPEDGSVRWRASLPRPGVRLLDADGRPDGAQEQLLLASDPEALQAWDVVTGELQWQVPWPETSHVVGSDVVGDQLLLATSGALPTVLDDALDVWWARSGIVALHAASGELLWTLEVDRVVGLSPNVLVLEQGSLTALDPATGTPRWRHPGVAASTNEVGDEVAVADAAGVTVLDARTGAARSDVPIDLEAAIVRSREDRRSDPTVGIRLEVHDRLLAVATMPGDDAGQPVADEWELAVHDRADGRELRRHARAITWWRSDDDLLVVLGSAGEDVYLDARSTTQASEVWSRQLRASPTSRIRLDPRPGGGLLVSVARASDDVEVVSIDPGTGRERERYGGADWELLGDGILAQDSSRPVAGSLRVTRLAGPQGSLAFSRQVTIVSTRPMLVAYWDTLIRVDERLLYGAGAER